MSMEDLQRQNNLYMFGINKLLHGWLVCTISIIYTCCESFYYTLVVKLSQLVNKNLKDLNKIILCCAFFLSPCLFFEDRRCCKQS